MTSASVAVARSIHIEAANRSFAGKCHIQTLRACFWVEIDIHPEGHALVVLDRNAIRGKQWMGDCF